ncbi:nuclear transport factor 2 family protein [Candidatus Saccharibacteria bacterium]|nr:nuclear transport factor 2 family protein [Candidatus Saccharibacteria bacterium]
MNIEKWLDIFHAAWKNHDIEKVTSLFTDGVEYWENPHYRIADINQIHKEWQAIQSQKDIKVSTKLFASSDNRHTVTWELSYRQGNETKQSGGVYLIKLNDEGLCDYFYYVGEAKETK